VWIDGAKISTINIPQSPDFKTVGSESVMLTSGTHALRLKLVGTISVTVKQARFSE
jgi:hypothetical protein